MKSLLGRRDIRLLLGGQSLSMFGDWAMIIALGIWARVLTGSNAEAGLVFLCFGVTGMIAPLGGLVVDRLPKRPLMIALTSRSPASCACCSSCTRARRCGSSTS